MSAAITAAVIVAGGAAYAANKQSKAADKARKAGTGPWEETSTRQPWDEAMPYLSGALGENQRVYQQALAQYQRASRGGRRGGGGGYRDPVGGSTLEIANRVKDKAMNRDPLLEQARGYVGSTLGAGEDGPFGGNEIYNDLYGRLGGANFDRGAEMLEGFLGGTVGSDSAGYQGRSGGGVMPDGGPSDRGGALIPDSMRGSTFFNDQVRALFDPSTLDPENDPTLDPYVAALRREMGEDLEQQLLDIGDESNAIGMYGGSGRALEAARTREEGQEALGSQLAQVYMNAREANLGRRMQGLGMISDRDLAAMQDRSSSQLGNRSLDLEAIQAMLGYDMGGLEMLGGLGGELAGERRYGVEAAMGLEQQEMENLGSAFGLFSGMDQARSAARARAAAQANARSQQARRDALMPMSMFGDYLKGLGVLTDLGPSTTTASGKGARGTGGYIDSGPGAAAAGLSSLGGSMMALYGMGAFDRGGGTPTVDAGNGVTWRQR